MNICVVSPRNKSVFNFRGDLIRKMIALENRVVVVGPNKEYLEDLYELGIDKFIEVPFGKDKVDIRSDVSFCKFLYKIFKREKIDLVFSYTPKPVVYSCIAGRFAKVPRIFPMLAGLGRVYASNSIRSRLVRWIQGRLYKFAFRKATKVIFQNKDDLDLFVKLRYLSREKAVKVDGSGVDMNRFQFEEPSKEPAFLMVSRIIREKGVFEYAEAAKIVKSKYPNATFKIIGAYDSSIGAIKPEELLPYTKDGTIKVLAEVKDIVATLKEARFFVLPTYYYEGIPRTILEAMASGRFIITTDWRGCREAIQDGVSGYLIPPKDSNALANTMIRAIENPEFIQKAIISSFIRCKEFYDVNVVNKKMLAIMGLD